MHFVVVDGGTGVVVTDNAIVGDAESDHADGTFLTETDTVAEAMSGERDAVGGAVVEDREEGGAKLEVGADAGEGNAAKTYLACGLAEGEEEVADAVVVGVEMVFLREIFEPFVFVDDFYPFALPHVVGESIGDGAEVGHGSAPNIFGIGGLAAAVGMKGCFNEGTSAVDNGHATA